MGEYTMDLSSSQQHLEEGCVSKLASEWSTVGKKASM